MLDSNKTVKFDPLYASVRAISRVDSIDADRNIVYIEDAWIGFRWWRLYVKAGWQLYNWTGTEAFHPADVMNSRNFDSDLENAEKLGELSASLEIEIPFGSITAYYMPYYQDPKFAGSRVTSKLHHCTFRLQQWRSTKN